MQYPFSLFENKKSLFQTIRLFLNSPGVMPHILLKKRENSDGPSNPTSEAITLTLFSPEASNSLARRRRQRATKAWGGTDAAAVKRRFQWRKVMPHLSASLLKSHLRPGSFVMDSMVCSIRGIRPDPG